MSSFLDALDALATARNLVELIAMTTRNYPDSDQRAISAGCHAALEHLSGCEELLKEARREGEFAEGGAA